ncbi:hypothetical protein ES703_91240 [subsurface metagenome]
MAKRDEVMQRFGPKLLEGFLEMIFSENNLLRTNAGLPPRTKQQVYDEIMNHTSTLPDYEWMTEEP